MRAATPGNTKSVSVISSRLTFAIALTLYWITADPGVSYWDCPEYVTIASRMEVGHPPGNPIWMLAMRVLTIPFPATHHALAINLCSGLFMAFSAFFLCRIIFFILNSIASDKNDNPSFSSVILNGFVSAGGALCFAFCDSVWFSAVEAEVYAMSTFLASLSLWLMTEWWEEQDSGRRTRLLILIAYITGLSLGVHQLNLLLIPVFTVIVFYKSHPNKINPLRVLTVWIASTLFVGLILMGLIPGLLYGAKSFELFGVNVAGLPYDAGVIIFCLLILALFIISLILSHRVTSNYNLGTKINLHTLIWMGLFLLLGFSSFGMIMIRAKAYPGMNEGVPDNIFALSSYISRDQYPSQPLIYGHTPYSQPVFQKGSRRYVLQKEKGLYQPYIPEAQTLPRSGMLSEADSVNNRHIIKKGKGYVLTDYKFSQVLTPELDMWLPRITSRNINDRLAYQDWAGMREEDMEKVSVSRYNNPENNNPGDFYISYRPTYLQNLRYFIAYQNYYMYFRYLFWNFIGRQNDFHSTGEIEHGNFVTGFPFIDNMLIGDTSSMPPEIWEQNKGRNRYFGIPFIIGIVGILALTAGQRKQRRVLTIITILFVMTGIAIVTYLNQTPGEPRERDYTFLISFLAFSIWIAIGLQAILRFVWKYSHKAGRFQTAFTVVLCVLSLCPATLMALENFDDHDRRGRSETTYFASSLLDFEIPAIIFSHGDNSSFPLWYSSEVLDKGKNHTPVDITYLSLPSYVINLKKQGKKGIETIARTPEIAYGKYLLTKIPPDSLSEEMELEEALEKLYAQHNQQPVFPTSRVIIPSNEKDSLILNLRDFTSGSSYLSFKHLMLLDILAAQLKSPEPRALYFPYMIDYSFYKPLEPALKPVFSGKIYSPRLTDSQIHDLKKLGVERELEKLDNKKNKAKYVDPLLADRITRYRGELIIVADEFLSEGDTLTTIKIIDAIDRNYPFKEILPGNFTVTDSTYHEGEEYVRLMKKIYDVTGNETYLKKGESVDSLMHERTLAWRKFYNSLKPEQRHTLSNRSKRLL